MDLEKLKGLTDEKAAEFLGVAVQTLRNWRNTRRGPAYFKIGRSVRYRMGDLVEYMDVRRVNPDN